VTPNKSDAAEAKKRHNLLLPQKLRRVPAQLIAGVKRLAAQRFR
jgi:hypothetical protein